jgi:DNA-binding XRE family transcriptional regulator
MLAADWRLAQAEMSPRIGIEKGAITSLEKQT